MEVDDQGDVKTSIKKMESEELKGIVSSLKERLKEEQNEISALKEFIKQATDKDSGRAFVQLYLSVAPECKEIFALFESTGKPNNDKLTLIWNAFEGILSALSQFKEERKLQGVGSFISSKIIQNHIKLIYSSLSKGANNQLLQAVLKFLTFLIAQGVHAINEFLTSFDISFNGLRAAATKRDRKQKPDPRTCYVRFCLAFFVFGDFSVKKSLLEEKGLGNLLLNDLHQDTKETIIAVLEVLENKVILDDRILKKTKIVFFNPVALTKLSFLCKSSDAEIQKLVHDFLVRLCTDVKYGICFLDNTTNALNKLSNPVLLKFIQSIKQQVVTSSLIFELTNHILHRCNDVIVPYVSNIHLQLDLKHKSQWNQNAAYLARLWKSIPKLEDCISSKPSKEVLMKLAVPPNISRSQFIAGIVSKDTEVKMITLDLLNAVLTRCFSAVSVLKKYSKNVNGSEELAYSIFELLPDTKSVIGIRQANIEGKSAPNLSQMENDDGIEQEEMEIDEKDDAEKSDECGSNDVQACLLERSVHALYLYQCIKPGILTESGFNICKLLVLNKRVNENVIKDSLDLMLKEKHDVMSWLDKKIPEASSIVHLILQLMNNYRDNGEIVTSCKRLLIKIFNPIGHFNRYLYEINLWLDNLILLSHSEDVPVLDIYMKFADSLVQVLRDPFQYYPEDIFPNTTGAMELFSPLLYAVTEDFSEDVYAEFFVAEVLKSLLISQIDPTVLKTFIELRKRRAVRYELTEEFLDIWCILLTKDGNRNEVNGSNYHPKRQSKLHKGNFVSEILQLFVNTCTATNHKKSKRYLQEIQSLENEILEFFNPSQCLLIKPRIIIACNLLLILYNATQNKEEEINPILELFFQVFDNIFKQIIKDENKETDFIIELIDAIFKYDFLSGIGKIETLCWLEFSNKIYVNCLQIEEFQESSLFLEKLHLVIQNVVSTHDISFQLYLFFEKTLPYFTTSNKAKVYTMALEMLQEVEVCIKNNSLPKIRDLLQLFVDLNYHKSDNKTNDTSDTINVSMLLNYCLDYSNGDIASVIQSIITTSDINDLSTMSEKQIYKMFSQNTREYAKLSELILIRNPGLLDSLVQNILRGKFDNNIEFLINRIELLMEGTTDPDMKESLGVYLVGKCVTGIKDYLSREVKDSDELNARLSSLLNLFPYTNPEDRLIIIASIGKGTRIHESVLPFFKKSISMLDLNSKIERSCLLKVIQSTLHIISKSISKENPPKLFINCLDYIIKNSFKVTLKFSSKELKDFVPTLNNFILITLKRKYEDSKCVFTVNDLITKFYNLKKYMNIENILKIDSLYQMVISHSKFMDILFSKDETTSDAKVSLLTLIKSLIQLQPDVCKQALVPVLLAAYSATLSKQDQLLISILQLYESADISLSNYQPLVWGERALVKYKQPAAEVQKNLLQDSKLTHFLGQLDSKRIMKTAIELPLDVKLGKEELAATTSAIYDPAFLSLIFDDILQPGEVVDCRQFVDAGCLSVIIGTLSLHDVNMRKLAYTLLSLFNDHLDSSKFREKSQISYLMLLLKNSVDEEYKRLPSIWTAFLVRFLYISLKQDHPMYNIVNKFILQKPVLNFKEFSLFLPLFNSTSLEHMKERNWLLKLLVNGLKDQQDYYLYKKHHVFELCITYYDSPLVEKSTKELIIKLFEAACNVNVAVFDLVKTNSILSWIHMEITKTSPVSASTFYKMLYIMTETFNKSPVDSPEEEEVHCTADIEQRKLLKKKQLVIPRVFLYEASFICLHQFEEISVLPWTATKLFQPQCSQHLKSMNLKKLQHSAQYYVCCVLIWIMQVDSYFGDITTWIQKDDLIRLLETVTELLFTENFEEVTLEQVDDLFTQTVEVFLVHQAELLQKDLERFPWKEVYRRAREKNFTKIQHFMKYENRYILNGILRYKIRAAIS